MTTTIRDRIIEYLGQHPEGVDDDALADALNLKRRQQANSRCRQLAQEGILQRRKVHGKIHNFLIGPIPARDTEVAREPQETRPWFWEGNVQAVVVRHLCSKGYDILSEANTATRQPGKDVIAHSDRGLLWVTVKGYPEGTDRTRPSTQAGHWFKNALFDMVVWHGDDAGADLALALPDFPRYRKLAARVAWLQPVARFSFLWVLEDGTVEEVGSHD